MDNITHSLVGAALTDLALRPGSTRIERRLFIGSALAAANASDLDLLYTGITPAPLGYLLHHRGHTHTILGLVVLGMLLTLLCWLSPWARRLVAGDRHRLWLLIAAGLGSHLLLDAFNSYGIHPFYPFDSSWYYGDAVFIFEPWVWLLLGVAVVWNVWNRLARFTVAALVGLLPATLTALGIVPIETLVALILGGAALALGVGQVSPARRAALALAATALIFAGMFGVSRVARRVAHSAAQLDARGKIVDVILTPNPASPLCWVVIAIEKDEDAGEFVLRRGTLSLFPGWRAATDCASYRFDKPRQARFVADGRLAWTEEIQQPIKRLRDLSQRDCWVRAWLQFGRAPVLGHGTLFDLRFQRPAGENFTTMGLKPEREAARCPANITNWAMPRADLLDGSR